VKGEAILPLLTVFLCEFIFLITAVGAYIGMGNIKVIGIQKTN